MANYPFPGDPLEDNPEGDSGGGGLLSFTVSYRWNTGNLNEWYGPTLGTLESDALFTQSYGTGLVPVTDPLYPSLIAPCDLRITRVQMSVRVNVGIPTGYLALYKWQIGDQAANGAATQIGTDLVYGTGAAVTSTQGIDISADFTSNNLVSRGECFMLFLNSQSAGAAVSGTGEILAEAI